MRAKECRFDRNVLLTFRDDQRHFQLPADGAVAWADPLEGSASNSSFQVLLWLSQTTVVTTTYLICFAITRVACALIQPCVVFAYLTFILYVVAGKIVIFLDTLY